ncbi:hypothetical protein PQX77_010534 [Marasmius sp. AFHP31]|nr:hypothetical protein PQX77_010534 [Marasmius sp. AFHP31]
MANLVYAVGMMIMSVNFDGIGCAVQMWLLILRSTLFLSFILHRAKPAVRVHTAPPASPEMPDINQLAIIPRLVMIHGLNGQRMEKYYYFCSFLLALGLSLPPLIAGQFGWDPIEQTCGWSSQDQAERLKWRVGTMLFWIVLTIVGEIITFSAVLIFMVRARIFARNGSSIKPAMSTGAKSSSDCVASAVSKPRAPSPYSPPKLSRASSSISLRSTSPSSAFSHRYRYTPTQYRTIILRIALYPLAAAVTLGFTVFSDVYQLNRTGADGSSEVGRVLVVLCSFRPLIYAILAFWDPSLTRALKVLYYIAFEKGQLEENEVAFTETRTERRRGCPGNAHSPTTTRMGHRKSGSSGPKTVEITIPAFALAPPPPPSYCLSLSSPSSASLASTVDPERGSVQPEDSFELGLGETFLEAESMRIVPWRISGMSGVGVGFISVERTPVGADAGEADVEFGKLI